MQLEKMRKLSLFVSCFRDVFYFLSIRPITVRRARSMRGLDIDAF